jgi:xylulose-5-phosphate/fructose-6-phosphate phosphoketolase
MVDERLRLRRYTRDHGDDAPEVRDWTLPGRPAAGDEPPRGHPA